MRKVHAIDTKKTASLWGGDLLSNPAMLNGEKIPINEFPLYAIN